MKFNRDGSFQPSPLDALLDFWSYWASVTWSAWRHINRSFNQWVVRIFMRDLHNAHQRLHNEYAHYQKLYYSIALDDIQERELLQHERVLLTEVVASLVAKDDAGDWTTVFEADTRLPDEYQAYLNKLVHAA